MLITGNHFPLGAQQQVDVLVMAFYIIYVHFFYWFSCVLMADAPSLLLELHKDLSDWQSRDPNGARAGLRKVDLHTEYLTGRSIIFAFASDKVQDKTKAAMAEALKSFDRNAPVEMGKPSMPRIYDDSVLQDFINEESWLFFKVRVVLIDTDHVIH